MGQDVATQEAPEYEAKPIELAIAPQINPLQMIQTALDKGVDTEQLKMMMDLSERFEANEARKAFVAAMSDFRGKAVTILKTRQVSYTTDKGTTSYSHAELADVIQAAVPALSECGLSHRWETEQEDGHITVTCVLTHRQGHSESTKLLASPDASGGKNNIQAIGSTVSYLERYTFLAATGLAAGTDDDGTASGPRVERVSAEQLQTLKNLIKESGADEPRFLEYCAVDKLEDIAASRFNACMDALNHKKNSTKQPEEAPQ